jgi:hypothetical protein
MKHPPTVPLLTGRLAISAQRRLTRSLPTQSASLSDHPLDPQSNPGFFSDGISFLIPSL